MICGTCVRCRTYKTDMNLLFVCKSCVATRLQAELTQRLVELKKTAK